MVVDLVHLVETGDDIAMLFRDQLYLRRYLRFNDGVHLIDDLFLLLLQQLRDHLDVVLVQHIPASHLWI